MKNLRHILRNPLFWVALSSILLIFLISIDILLCAKEVNQMYYAAIFLPSVLMFFAIFTNNFKGCNKKKTRKIDKKELKL